MKLDPKYYDLVEVKYKQFVGEINDAASIALAEFLALNITEFKQKKSLERQLMYLSKLYKKLMFIRNDHLIKKLKEFGIKKHELQWFISLEDIEAEFINISKQGIKVDKRLILKLIISHLVVKFNASLLRRRKFTITHDNVSMNIVSKHIHDLGNRVKDSNGYVKNPKDIVELLLSYEFGELISEFPDKLSYKWLENMSKAKTESAFLKNIIEDGFEYDQETMSQNKFLGGIYDLFRLIMQDYCMETSEKFFDKADIVESKYEIYKAKKLKKLIKNKKASFKF
jgi:hypothetical protein